MCKYLPNCWCFCSLCEHWVSICKYELSYLVEGHQLLAIHLLGLVQWDKFNVLRGQGLIGERPLDGVQVVGTDGNQSPLTGQVLVEFVLEGNERLITGLVELDAPKDGT